ncbi:YraN family protein [Psychrobacter sp. TAE2020]|uniref:YraN family protein n=1 Tax=Psychrobacter sp. TAE2020 TaxID=2846762 RepID=UPI001C120C01|nr:YraN family protein [Psychrobacter sp. TAE2020]MBU5617431.1 YraN family protein [Psychrobacter sp. TAE2020]
MTNDNGKSIYKTKASPKSSRATENTVKTNSAKNVTVKTVTAKNSKPRNQAQRPLLATSPKQLQGNYYEQLACQFLQQQGLTVVVKNWQQPKVGELDLVMLQLGPKRPTLVFVEVRQRQRSNFGDAALSVTARKQAKVIKTAQYFLQQYPHYADYECRFDVVVYDIDKGISTEKQSNCQPNWLISAFVAQAW